MLQHFPVPVPVMRGSDPRPGNSGLALILPGCIGLFYPSSRSAIKGPETGSRKFQRGSFTCAVDNDRMKLMAG
jgi:hypothetical protein